MDRIKPKILLVTDGSFIDYIVNGGRIGGGTISTHQLLKYISDEYDIHILSSCKNCTYKTFSNTSMTIHNFKTFSMFKGTFPNLCIVKKQFEEKLKKIISEISPQILMSQVHFIAPTVKIGKQFNIPSLVWIRAYENFYESEFYYKNSFLGSINYFITGILFKTRDRFAIKEADAVLTNSKHMQKMIKETFEVESEIVYPCIDLEPYQKIEKTGVHSIGFINPTPRKGFGILKKIARALPDKHFICFGKPPSDHMLISATIKNIYFASWFNDHTAIFSKIHLLLVPSKWPEPFGRVAIEALASGVVPIVSERGGLVEAVGHDERIIIKNIYDIKEWKEKILELLENRKLYEAVSTKGFITVKKYNRNHQGEKFRKIIHTLILGEPEIE